MKKFIAAFDGLRYMPATAQYAIELASRCQAHLVGIFLDDPTRRSYSVFEMAKQHPDADSLIKQKDEEDRITRRQASDQFEMACRAAGITHSIHHDHQIARLDLLHESIFADLLIINHHETLTRFKEPSPTRFIRDIISESVCPVLLVPDDYRAFSRSVLLYDGEPSSVQAIKMLSYVLPSLHALPTDVVTVNVTRLSSHIPDSKLMKEFMHRHFPHAKYHVLNGFADESILTFLEKEKEQVLLVLGANKRGAIASLFHESMSDILLRETAYPLFIQHG
jgi:hypothetical protein